MIFDANLRIVFGRTFSCFLLLLHGILLSARRSKARPETIKLSQCVLVSYQAAHWSIVQRTWYAVRPPINEISCSMRQ